MALFQEDLANPNQQSFVGASKGIPTDKTMESLFKGIGQVGDAVVKAHETQTVSKIQNEARQGFDDVNEGFGVTPPPAGFESEAGRIQRLQSAFEQGGMRPADYYARLADMSKKLRSKYPGFESEVDRAIQAATGTRPANAYRDALFNEMRQQWAEASSEEKFWRQWEKENEVFLPQDYFNNPDKYDRDELRVSVASQKQEIEGIKNEKARLELQAKKGQVNEVQARKVLSREFSQIVGSSLSTGLDVFNKDFYTELNAFVSQGPNVSGDERLQFSNSLLQLREKLKISLVQAGSEYSGVLTQNDINKAVEEALFPVQTALEAIEGGDYTLAAHTASLIKARENETMAELQKDPRFRVGAGLKKAFGEVGLIGVAETIDEIGTQAMELAGQSMLGNQGGTNKAVESGDKNLSKATFDSHVQSLKSKDISPEAMSNVVKEMFSPGGVAWVSPEVVDANDLLLMYTTLISPEMTENILSKGSQEDINTYAQWAYRNLQNVPEIREMAANLSDIREGGRFNLSFEERDGIFEFVATVSPEAQAAQEGLGIDLQLKNDRFLSGTLGKMNGILRLLTPIIQGTGANPEEELYQIIKQIDNRYSERSGNTFIGDFAKSILEYIESLPEDRENKFPNQGPPGIHDFRGDDTKRDNRNRLRLPTDTFEEFSLSGDGVLDFVSLVQNASFTGDGDLNREESLMARAIDIGETGGEGSYDTLLGFSHREGGTFSNIKPSQMTIDELIEFSGPGSQYRKFSKKHVGRVATPMGRYQIVGTTLRELKESLELKGTELFDAKMQDQLFKQLLEKRGYSDFLDGKISADKFLNRLDDEWEGLKTSRRSRATLLRAIKEFSA